MTAPDKNVMGATRASRGDAMQFFDIPGGIHPAERKELSNRTPIQSMPLPARLILPLSQHIGSAAEPASGKFRQGHDQKRAGQWADNCSLTTDKCKHGNLYREAQCEH